MNNQQNIPFQKFQQLRATIHNNNYNTSLQQFNQFLGEVEQYLSPFNQQNLEQISTIFGMILDDLSYLQLKPIIQIWRINFTDLLPSTFNPVFGKALCYYYTSLSECSQIFKTQIFNELHKQITQILSIMTWDKDISEEVRHSKCLRSLIRMLRVNCSEELLTCFVIITKNQKNSEYMTIKKCQDQLMQYLKNNINRDQVQLIISNMCFNNDQRLLFWCQGILSIIKLTLDSSTLTLIWKLMYDCPEVIDELLKYQEFFNHLYKQVNQFTEESALIVGIIRKICENNESYKCQHIENIMNIFPNLLDNQQKINNQINQSLQIFVYRELFSFFGIVGNQYIQPQHIPNIIYLINLNINEFKLLTVGIGMLTNLSTHQQLLNTIQNEKIFYQIILQILENYHEKHQLIEYTLKLMINTLTNPIISVQYSQPRFIVKLLFIWYVNPEQIIINNLIVRILRGLYVITNANAHIFNQCIQDLQTRNSMFDFVNLCTISLNVNIQQSKFDNVVEIYILMSIIPDLKYTNPQFQTTIKTFVDAMKQKGELKKALQVVSHLPIEDIGLQF